MYSLTYPKSTDDNPLYVVFTAHEMTAADVLDWGVKRIVDSESAVTATSNLNAQGTICLALPSSTLTETFSANWSVSNMTSGLNNSVAGDITQTVTGAMVPPLYKTRYIDSTPRTFSFNFHFLPKNRDEEGEVIKIIQTLKKWASPGTLSDAASLDNIIPYVLKIEFVQGAKKLQEMIMPQFFVIDSVSVNYFDTGQITAYESGMPKSTSMSISLKEITICTRKDWEKGGAI